ncbi:MAG: single-stranded-DNA-specific exonuclease RecJ [Thermomicrobiales bacterium]
MPSSRFAQIDPRARPKSWIDPEPVPPGIDPIHDHKLAHALLYRRGIRDRSTADTFLNSRIDESIDSSLLPDFGRAVDRITAAVRNGERIGIFGDYDVDGTTSAAMLFLALSAAGAGDRTTVRLPTRAEGYGLSGAAIEEFLEKDIDLLIALDCGSADHGKVAYARALGMEVVIVDHHQMRDSGPEDAIVVSAYRPEGGVYKELSAAGLTWQLVAALEDAGLRVADDDAGAESYLDLAALGLIGDVSTMTGASRVLVREGLRRLAQETRPGMAALASAANVDLTRVSSTDVSFRITPRLNAPGRMGDPNLALNLLLAPNLGVAQGLMLQLEELNARRKRATDEITRDAERLLQRDPTWQSHPVLVVQSEGWQAGVLGIVAAKLSEAHDRPAVVLVEEDGILRGSMRSPEGFDVAGALANCAPLLRTHGGHRLAGGLSLESGNVSRLIDQLTELAAERTPAIMPSLQLDAELQEKHLNLEIARLVRTLEPFGPGNEEPVFVLRNVRLQKYDAIGQTKAHLSLTVGNGRPVRAVFFNAASRSRELVGARAIDLAFTLGEGEWNGPKLDVLVKDFRAAQASPLS